MYVQFYDSPNANLVRNVMVEFDPMRITAMLTSLPAAMRVLMDGLPRLPESENSDFKAKEEHRKALNKVIRLAELLEEVIEVQTRYQTMTDFGLNEDAYWEAANAFRELQRCKNDRIAITHRDLGENFGSATGFQNFDYNAVAKKIEDWVNVKYEERAQNI